MFQRPNTRTKELIQCSNAEAENSACMFPIIGYRTIKYGRSANNISKKLNAELLALKVVPNNYTLKYDLFLPKHPVDTKIYFYKF